MNNDDIPEDFYRAVERAARNTAEKWPLEEWEDLSQDIWVRLLEKPNTLEKCLEADNPAPMLSRICGQIAAENQLKRNLFQGKNPYNPVQVRSMLDAGILKNYSVATVSESHDFSYGMLDLKKANDAYFQTIIQKYKKDQEVTDTKKVTRAIDKLTDLMNITVLKAPKYHDGLGSRRAMSNSASQNTKSFDWQGDMSDGFGRR